jgi:catechol 2,3-dioxygenase-like lactoylglutathione lyase family enzyme
MKSPLAALVAFLLLLAGPALAQPSDPQPALLPPAFDLSPLADDDIGLVARIHFATHTPDFDRARAFYRMLGYTAGVSGFALTNTHAMARALGMFDVCQYELVKGEVIALPGSLNTASIDLLQFKTPFDGRPPYQRPNHLGAAYSALLTTNLASDVAYLKSQAVQFLSEPYGVPGNRFAFFRDPDGVLFQLVENAPPQADAAKNMHLTAMPFVAINVKDIEASLPFYARFGYTDVRRFEHVGTLEEARAYGLDRAFHVRGADIALGRGDRHVLRLQQWIEPFDPAPANPAPINRIGIQRIALLTSDVDRAVAILKKQGVPFLSEVAPCCTGSGTDETGIVHAIDPDGVYLELVGQIARRPAQPQPEGCPPLEIKLPEKE